MPEVLPISTAHCTVEQDGHVVIVTMNRPEAKNALSTDMLVGMADAFAYISSEPSVRVGILTGAGGDFCSGADLKAMSKPSDDERVRQRASEIPNYHWKGLLREAVPTKPIICAIEGYAVAGGTELLMGTDLRVVADLPIPLATDIEHSRAFVEASLPDTDAYITRAIVPKDDGELIGLCGISVQRDYEAGEIWHLLDRSAWGNGVAFEAVAELLRMAFVDLELHRVWAACCPENSAAARVLVKAGMRLEGRHIRNLLIQGAWRDSDEYAILEDEWRATLGARMRALSLTSPSG